MVMRIMEIGSSCGSIRMAFRRLGIGCESVVVEADDLSMSAYKALHGAPKKWMRSLEGAEELLPQTDVVVCNLPYSRTNTPSISPEDLRCMLESCAPADRPETILVFYKSVPQPKSKALRRAREWENQLVPEYIPLPLNLYAWEFGLPQCAVLNGLILTKDRGVSFSPQDIPGTGICASMAPFLEDLRGNDDFNISPIHSMHYVPDRTVFDCGPRMGIIAEGFLDLPQMDERDALVFSPDGLAPMIASRFFVNTPVLYDGKLRKITPRECWRLQGFYDEEYDALVRGGLYWKKSLYTAAGRCWPINPIQAVIGAVGKEKCRAGD